MKTKQEFGVKCENHFHLSEMEADHITPWYEGGKTMKKISNLMQK
jgi:hypothetical protein